MKIPFLKQLTYISFIGLGLLVGVIIIGLPDANLINTFNGVPTERYRLSETEMSEVARGISTADSYFVFYGFTLPGDPFYWIYGTLAVCGFIGYKLAKILIHKMAKSSHTPT